MGHDSCSTTPARAWYGGFTLLEVILVVAILGTFLAVGFVRFGGSDARAYANDVKALVQQARFEAIKRNTPVAVVWADAEEEYRTVLGEPDTPCVSSSGVPLSVAEQTNYRLISVASGFVDGQGIVWLPSGQARSCSLGAFSPAIARISDKTREFVVTVSLTGRVTVQ